MLFISTTNGHDGHDLHPVQHLQTRLRNHRGAIGSDDNNKFEDDPTTVVSRRRILTTKADVPSPTPTTTPTATTEQLVPEKPSLEQATGHEVPERNDTNSRFSVELSFAVVALEEDENETHSDTLSTIVDALNVIIMNDTDYEVHSTMHNKSNDDDDNDDGGGVENNETDSTGLQRTQQQQSSWVYTLKLENATVKERENATSCHVIETNETIMVTWVKAVMDYFILPERRKVNDTQHENGNNSHHDEELLYDSKDSYEDKTEEDNFFEGIGTTPTDTQRTSSNGHHWDWDTVGSTVVNATMNRIDDGWLLEWIQEQDLSVVGVSSVGMENLTRCIVVDVNPTLDVPIPFVDPLDLASWDALQMLGSIMFVLTLMATSSLCFIGRNRSKAVYAEQSTAVRFGNEAAVNDFLDLSSMYLPPECISQRDANAAMLVTIPAAAEPQDNCPIRADGTACNASNH